MSFAVTRSVEYVPFNPAAWVRFLAMSGILISILGLGLSPLSSTLCCLWRRLWHCADNRFRQATELKTIDSTGHVTWMDYYQCYLFIYFEQNLFIWLLIFIFYSTCTLIKNFIYIEILKFNLYIKPKCIVYIRKIYIFVLFTCALC